MGWQGPIGLVPFLILVPFWYLRWVLGDGNIRTDLGGLFATALWHSRGNVWHHRFQGFFGQLRSSHMGLAFAACCISYFLLGRRSYTGKRSPAESSSPSGNSSLGTSLKPLIFPCRTVHTRAFPRKHSFSYSYLFVGIPIGWRGRIGSFLSVDIPSCKAASQGRSWFSIDCADYLNRGEESLGLKQKLHSYLQSQNEDPNEYTSVYLVTAPRFLGYSFNPVSFWYLYSDSGELNAMILEVNNTFDERRMYFLKKGMGMGLNSDDDLSNANNAKFSDTWTKDFHVSPFNSRKGSYALGAYDPFFPCLNGNGTINNTITLKSSKQHMKLTARIFSTSRAIDPATLGVRDRIKFVALWWWVGLVTFPRIVKEAGTLFFRRKLHVWYRPEVLKESIGRQATEDERIISQIFGNFLKHKIQDSNLVQPIRYIPAVPGHPREWIIQANNRSCPSAQSPQSPVEFKITTPLFYTRITRYAHLSEFLQSEILINNDKNRTFYISSPDVLLNLFQAPKNKEFESSSSRISSQSPFIRVQWAFLHWLRNLKVLPASWGQTDIRQFPLSQLDHFVVQYESAAHVQKYWTTVVKLLLSNIFAFGIPAVVDAIFVVVRFLLYYLTVIVVGDLITSVWKGNL